VDDHEAIHTGVRALLATEPRWEVCGEAADGERALGECVRLVPNVVILDLSLPVMNGFDVAEEIRRVAPSTKIVLFSMHQIPTAARTVGADAFVAKSSGNAVGRACGCRGTLFKSGQVDRVQKSRRAIDIFSCSTVLPIRSGSACHVLPSGCRGKLSDIRS
jgi:DNA-binding NarL/FixJ family response regulator